MFFILFCLFVSGSVFSQSNEDLAVVMFTRIHDRTQTWWRNNFSIIDDFSFTPRTNTNIQIIASVLTQQIRINTIMFQNLANRKELREDEIYFFYIEQFKLLSYMENTIGNNREGNNILVALAEELRATVIQACLLLIEQ